MFNSKIIIYEISSEEVNDRPKTYLIFDNEASEYLRDTKRICSRKIGTWFQNQSAQAFMPLQLSNEEVCLLSDLFSNELKFLKTEFNDFSTNKKLSQFKSKFKSYLTQLNSKQIEIFKFNRKKQMIAKKDQILNGKRKKIAQQIDKINESILKPEITDAEKEKLNQQKDNLEYNLSNLELIFDQELDDLEHNNNFFNEVEIFHSTPDFYESIFKTQEISIEEFRALNKSNFLNCKYSTFKHLYMKGYYLTSGAKFGGDFLVYPGVPEKYHSQFILVCFESEHEYNSITLKQFITYARMATTVKKTFLVSFIAQNKLESGCLSINLGDQRFLNFLSINWSHI